MTGKQCIDGAATLLGVIDPGEGLNTSEYAQALIIVNNLLNSLSLERLNIPVITTITHDLVTGTATYTLGSAGTLGSTRPIRIERIQVTVPNAGSAGKLEFECKLIPFDQFADIHEKGAKAVTPFLAYYDYAYPVGNISFWPTPTFTTITPQVVLYVWQALSTFPDTTTDEAFPQGYDRAVVTLSAIDLATMFSIEPRPALINSAQEARAALRALNAVPQGQPAPAGPENAIPQQA